MASSVSSERAFSSAGITISKRRNRLKGIIVEALQCLKCLYKRDLIFREVITALKETLCMEKDELLDSAMDADIEKDKEFSWDSLLDDDDGDDDDDETDL
jgi:hAT family C-terminal dimerisation region